MADLWSWVKTIANEGVHRVRNAVSEEGERESPLAEQVRVTLIEQARMRGIELGVSRLELKSAATAIRPEGAVAEDIRAAVGNVSVKIARAEVEGLEWSWSSMLPSAVGKVTLVGPEIEGAWEKGAATVRREPAKKIEFPLPTVEFSGGALRLTCRVSGRVIGVVVSEAEGEIHLQPAVGLSASAGEMAVVVGEGAEPVVVKGVRVTVSGSRPATDGWMSAPIRGDLVVGEDLHVGFDLDPVTRVVKAQIKGPVEMGMIWPFLAAGGWVPGGMVNVDAKVAVSPEGGVRFEHLVLQSVDLTVRRIG